MMSSLPPARKPSMVVNGRFRSQIVTGVQRYAHEISSRLTDDIEVLTSRFSRGAVGHLWEQTLLPWTCDDRLLWNPNACGPLLYGSQVVTFHDLFPVEHPEWYGNAYAWWYGIVMRRLAAHAVHIIAVSEYTKSRIVARFGRAPEDITVVHNGGHVSVPRPGQIEDARQHLDLGQRRYILSLSSLESRKNLTCLLQAWARVYPELPKDVWLVLAGPRVAASVYGAQANMPELPRVILTGYVPEQHLAGLYGGADLFVFPSIAEGFGLPLLEAMSCGTRCIASRSTSLPEVGGSAVKYFEPTDVDQLARLLRRELNEPSPRGAYQPSLEQAGRFSWDTASTQTRSVLELAQESLRSGLGLYATQRMVH